MGAAGRAAPGGAEHLPADAAARPQHRRLHAVPDRGHRRVRRTRPPRTGIDVFRIFDALNDVEQMRPGDRGGARDRHRGRRGRALLHRRPVRPGREALHARLLPAASPSGSSTPARTSSRSRTWPGCCARRPRARWSRALRERFDLPVHLHTHDTAGGQLGDPARRDRRRRRRRRRRQRLDGRHHQPAAAVGAGRGDRPHRRATTGLDLQAVCDLEPYWEAVRRRLRAVRVRAALARPAGSTPTRSPAASCPTCASRRSRSASARSSSRSRTCTPRPTDILGNIVKVTPSSKVVGDLALHLVGGRRRPGRVRGRTRRSSTSPTRSSASSPASSATRPAAGPSRSAPRRSQGRTVQAARSPSSTAGAGARACAPTPRRTLNRLLFPGPTKEFAESRETYGDLSVLADRRLPLRPAPAARSTRSSSRRASG